ncbi:MAG: cytochrome-c peroxidase [Bacteroidetes bacterium]|nr:cytochrome-c peroxidase [Bacteroidota bacterium]
MKRFITPLQIKKAIGMTFLSALVLSCSVDPEITPTVNLDNIQPVIPDGWPTPVYNFENNPLTPAGFDLGHALFYEPMLSVDNTVSCSSCHQQFAAFAQADHDFSHGINGLLGKRNAPALQNLNWNPYFMHDGGINNIEVQPTAPITNPVEMGETISNVVFKLSNSSKYRTLFKNAFGDETVNSQRMLKALAQFMGALYSYNSKYDQVRAGKASFTAAEQQGYTLFQQKCASCHVEPLFSDYQFRNNGLAVNTFINDSGRAHITQLPADLWKFKTPSLRNIEKSKPYMHDGRFTTLDQCLDHYVSGIVSSATLDPQLASGIALSSQDKTNIIAFLKTLTDTKFLTDVRYSENYK